MKRFITMIVAVCAFFAVSAQNPMVTLSHNGELSFFTHLGAFQSALDSAKNGDIIYLSKGEFILNGGNCTIDKRLNIVGSGYSSHILGNITIDMVNNPNSWMDAPLFDGVRLDKLEFNTSERSSKNLGETEIRRTWIRELKYGDAAGTDVTYDKCYIENTNFGSKKGNVMLTNSKIGYIDGAWCEEIIVRNCNIDSALRYPRTMFSSILNQETACETTGSHTIINSLLRIAPNSQNVTTYNCYISEVPVLDNNLEACVNLIDNKYFGQDGTTEVGIHGGESPFSENPSVPTVDSANSTVEYDAASNKLKVNITVKAD